MASRSWKGPRLPFLTDRQFEDKAELLLVEYGAKRGPVAVPPIPIDDIVELHLDLTLEFIDTRKEFGVDDVHGALWVNKKKVGIDERLDPVRFPVKLGRYRFTLAHEAAHWRLHRHLFTKNANELSLLPEGTERPEYICRSRSVEPIEHQANRFASCLLMPLEMMKQAWREWRGDLDPIYLPELRANAGVGATDSSILEGAVCPLATKFQVSPEAMRIRAEGMRLLLREKLMSLF